MWDFLVVVWQWAQKKLGRQFNRIVVGIAIAVAGWYAHTGVVSLVKVYNKVTTIEQRQAEMTDEVAKIHLLTGEQASKLQEHGSILEKVVASQTVTHDDLTRVSHQLDTLQTVLINKLNLILPTPLLSDNSSTNQTL